MELPEESTSKLYFSTALKVNVLSYIPSLILSIYDKTAVYDLIKSSDSAEAKITVVFHPFSHPQLSHLSASNFLLACSHFQHIWLHIIHGAMRDTDWHLFIRGYSHRSWQGLVCCWTRSTIPRRLRRWCPEAEAASQRRRSLPGVLSGPVTGQWHRWSNTKDVLSGGVLEFKAMYVCVCVFWSG